jgi:hypothetical protein
MACAAIVFAGSAFAGTQVLGFEIGASSVDQVRGELAKKTQVQDAGTNKFSGGTMLKTDGASYDISGLNNVLYIFDDQKKLMGVVMSMAKGGGLNNEGFNQIYKIISSKYKLVSEQRPFVGNQYARFNSPDSIIEIQAQHLSFEMEVRYIRKDLMAKFNAQSMTEAAEKKKSEASKF